MTTFFPNRPSFLPFFSTKRFTMSEPEKASMDISARHRFPILDSKNVKCSVGLALFLFQAPTNCLAAESEAAEISDP